ncbi:hypothetical protein [Streptomyces sp. NPDC002133]|uniref:hypothetical protein n=1 Tax=Streptomyces sp. NPDC002133 TaxID=3154409 RepID=UPI0033342F59
MGRTYEATAAAAIVAAALLSGLLSGCGPQSSPAGAAASAPARPSDSPSLPLTPGPTPPLSATPQAGPSGYEGSAAPSAPASPTPAATTVRTPPPRPTELAMFASTQGGRIDLARGGPAKEFTVSVHNGNTRAYAEVAVAFQMEILESGAPGPAPRQNGFVVERRNPATGRWTEVELRVANDVQPLWLTATGSPLALEASRVERFRIRAIAEGPQGSTPLMIELVDATAPEDAFETAFLSRTRLMVGAEN